MDRSPARPGEERPGDGRGPEGGNVLPSRRTALSTLRAALEAQSGPVSLTGDAGTGKTWLWRRLPREMPPSWRWVGLDLSPANDPAALYRGIGYALGLSSAEPPGASGLELADFLKGESADGVRWVLVVDEAQSVSADVLEEIRILGNRLGAADGPAGLILVGQSVLARRLASRPLSAMSLRLSARVHLRPVDVDEARLLVDSEFPDLGWDDETLDLRHRDCGGNPRRLLSLARWCRGVPSPVRPVLGPTSIAPPEARTLPAWEAPVLGPTRPPIRMEEGLIEVGWDPTVETGELPEPPSRMESPQMEPAIGSGNPPGADVPESDEPIDDHYAALQAWNEWSRHQGRSAGTQLAESLPPSIPEAQDEGPRPDRAPAIPDHPAVRAEAQQGFAPYGQLFTQLRQARDRRS